MKNLLSLVLISALSFPSVVFAKDVEVVEFGAPSTTIPNTTPPMTPVSASADTATPQEPVASVPAPKSCEDTCDAFNDGNDLTLNGCGTNATCKTCMTDRLGSSQVGQYCEAKAKYEKGMKKQGIDAGLYLAGGTFCMLACFNVEPTTKVTMDTMCKVSSIGLAVKNLLMSKDMTEKELETAKWLQTANKFSSVARTATGAIAVAQQFGGEAIKESLKKIISPNGISCVTGALLLATSGIKFAHVPSYGKTRDRICKSIESFHSNVTSSTNSCRQESGMGMWGNRALTFKRPAPFVMEPSSSDSSAITDGGLIGELYTDKKPFEDAYKLLPTGVRTRLENGENPLDAARAENLLPAAVLDEVSQQVSKYSDGKTMAFLGGGDSTATLAGGAKSGTEAGAGMGNGLSFDSFGNGPIAAGEGAKVDDFGAAAGSANGAYGKTCGLGPLHEGCTRSLFSIVSDQLGRKSKDESIARLDPALPLNQMRSGMKVETKRTPANAPSKVK